MVCLVTKSGQNGWLARNSSFHPCNPTEHDAFAHDVLGKEVAEMEATGWVRVQFDQPVLMGWHGRYSLKQAQWLRARGVQIEDYDILLA